MASARQLARELRTVRGFTPPAVPTVLARLESVDLAKLTPERKAAIHIFWAEYLESNGHAPEVHTDGIGVLFDGQQATEPWRADGKPPQNTGKTQPQKRNAQ